MNLPFMKTFRRLTSLLLSWAPLCPCRKNGSLETSSSKYRRPFPFLGGGEAITPPRPVSSG